MIEYASNVLLIQAMNGVRLGVIEQVALFFCCGWRLLTPEDTVAIAFTVSPFLAIRSLLPCSNVKA